MILWEWTILGGSRGSKFNLIPLGDTHVGVKAFNRSKFLEHVKWIKETDKTYWVGVGDYCEYITPKDVRFDPSMIDPLYSQKWVELRDLMTTEKGPTGFRALSKLPQIQANDFIKMVEPIKDKCIGLAMGNHEWDIENGYGFPALDHICRNLNVKNLGWSSLTRLKFSMSRQRNHHVIVTMHIEHGSTMGRKKGGKVNRLEDRMGMFEADIYVGGHSHDRVATTRDLLYIPHSGKLQLKAKKQVFVIVPSFFRTYTEGVITYAERKGYPPTSTGAIKITIEPFKHSGINMHVSQ